MARSLLLLSGVFAACMGGCRPLANSELGDANESSGRLTITGSSTMAPLVAEIAKRFEQQHPGVRIDVQTGGSSRGIADARRGTAEIGMASRALHAEEHDLKHHTIARDGICLILHRENPLRQLSSADVAEIYTGQATNWKRFGGKDAPITVVNKAAGRSTLELFAEFFQLDVTTIRAHVVIGDNQHGIKTVAGDPHSIGYVSIGSARFEAERGVPIKLLPINGMEPRVESVRDGSFPLARPLNLVTREPGALSDAFIQFATSPEVADLVEAQSFVPMAQ